VPRGAGVVIAIRLYTRSGCHLCDDMKAVLQRVVAATAHPIEIEEIDISTDAALEARYGEEIPVLEIDGRKAAKYRIAEDALKRMLAGGAE
jgi:thiol-disulfide isomerase/thioredoxin